MHTFMAPPNDLSVHTDTLSLTDGLMEPEHKERVSVPVAPPATQITRRRHAPERSRQALRIQRMWRLALFAGLYLSILALFESQGLISGTALLGLTAVVGTTVLALCGIFITGLNQGASEKSLTAPITLAAFAVLLLTLYVAPRTEGLVVPFAFLVVAYGTYRLPTRTIFMLAISVLAGDALIILSQAWPRFDEPEVRIAALHWLVLAVTLPGFVIVAGRVRRLHSALHKAGVKIKNIEEHARRDALLGCYNRRYMIAALEEHKRQADESGLPLCLAVIDLDQFKSINDEVGHLAGDEVLRGFARVAQDNVRQSDVFGRYGGEEFVLVLPDTQLIDALNTAERIREQIESHCWKGLLQRSVTISVGLTQYMPGESVLGLFSRTDTAMYSAKRGGRNQVVVQEPSAELWQAADPDLTA